MQGFVNHLFWDGLVLLLGREKALLWPYSLKLVSKNYQGEIFEGNACKVLLEHSDKLLESKIYGDLRALKLVPYVLAFKAMNKVVSKYFSTKENDTDFKELEKCLKELRKAFEATGI